jgi:hypothetical protein
MTKYLLLAIFILLPVSAKAGCELSTTPCSTDSRGNTYHTNKNLGGGYNTYKNGQLNSQTNKNLSGGYTTDYQGNSPSVNHNYNPYKDTTNNNNPSSYNYNSYRTTDE